MAYVTLEYAKEVMLASKINLFMIQASDGRTTIIEQNDEELSVKNAIELLEKTMNALTGNYVIIKTRSIPRGEKAGGVSKTNYYEWQIDLKNKNDQAQQINATPNNDSRIFELMQQIQRLEIDSIRKDNEYQMKELRRELTEKDTSIMGHPSFVKLVDNLVPHLLNPPAPVQAAPKIVTHGLHGATETVQTSEEKVNRIKNALKRLGKVDLNIIETLELIASFAEQNRIEYMAFIPMLKEKVK